MDMSLVDLYEPEGYEAFLGRSHNEEYDLTCPDSIVPLLNKCILPSTIQVGGSSCRTSSRHTVLPLLLPCCRCFQSRH